MQLSRMGMGAGFSELVEGGRVIPGEGEDGESSEEYDSDLDTGGGELSGIQLAAFLIDIYLTGRVF